MRLVELHEDKYSTKPLVSYEQPDMHSMLSDKAIDVAAFLQSKCRKWLAQTDNGKQYVYRSDEIYHRGSLAYTKNIRKDRKPKDTPEEIQNHIDGLLSDNGLIANRSNSMFVVGSRRLVGGYGPSVYIVLPTGNFKYTWSNKIDDLYLFIRDDFKNEFKRTKTVKFKKLIDSYKGDDGSLTKAINSYNEIMISATKSVLVHPDFYTSYVMPVLNGEEPEDNRMAIKKIQRDMSS